MEQRQFRSDDTSTWLEKYGDGSDGALTVAVDTTEAPIDASCSGLVGETSLAATNVSFAAGQAILIHQTRGSGVGKWELNVIDSYSAGTITLKYALCNTYTDSGDSQAQVRVLKQYSSVTINNLITYTAKAWNGNVGGILAFLCSGTVTVTGSTLGTGKGYIGGDYADGAPNPPVEAYSGEGSAGASVVNTAANGNSGGGGKYSNGEVQSSGGSGGHGLAGSNGAGTTTPGLAGGTSGNEALTLMTFGGAGGGGNGWSGGSPEAGTAGGNGGSIVLIIAKEIIVTGAMNNKGAAAADCADGSDASAGGSGAGGSILLKGKTVTLGTNLVNAAGGVAATVSRATAAAGAVGRIHVDYLNEATGTTTPAFSSTQDDILSDSSESASVSPSPSVSVSLSPSVSESRSLSRSPSPSSSISPSPSLSESQSMSGSPSEGYEYHTRGDEAVLPGTTNNLETIYSDTDLTNIATKNNVRVEQTGTLQYMIHQFKVFAGGKTACEIECELQTTLAPSSSTVYMQIYNHLTNAWETIDSDDDSPSDIDFKMYAEVIDLTNYKDDSDVLSCRVYQLST